MKNLKLFIILLILAGAAYGLNGPFKQWQEKRTAPKNFLASIDFGQADRIEIARADKTEILTKEGDRWKVAGKGDFYAAASAVFAMEEAFQEAAKSELEIVGANAEKKKDFGLDGQYGTEVRIYQNSRLIVDFLIGRLAEDFFSAYISRPDDSHTYLMPAGLRGAFYPGEWRDLTIFNFSPDKVSRLRFQYPGREFVLEKKEDKWAGAKPAAFAANGEKVKEIISRLSGLTAVSAPDQSFSGTDLEKHLIIVSAQGEEGEFTLMIGKDNGQGNYYAKRGDSDNIYLISKTDRDGFDKKIGDLK